MAVVRIIQQNQIVRSNTVGLQGPRGLDGPAGSPGPQGEQGPPGGSVPLNALASTLGIYHSTDSSAPAVGGTAWTALTPAQQAAANGAAYTAWRNGSSYARGTLLFDKPGTFYFPPDTLMVPFSRTLQGVASVVLRAASVGRALVVGEGSPATVRTLTLHGGGTGVDDDGSSALVDYLVETRGTLVPDAAGPSIVLDGVACQYAKVACIHARNSAVTLRDTTTIYSPLGIWSESCSECHADNVWSVRHSEVCILLEGEYAGTATRSGETMANGGRWTLNKIVTAVCQIGLHFNGIASGGGADFTCEGSSDTSYKFTKSTGVHLDRARSNAGNFVVFDDSNHCSVTNGNCISSQTVRHINNARACEARCRSESYPAVTDIDQVWVTGATEWVGQMRPDGTILSKNNTAPNAGYWEQSTMVHRKLPAGGQPYYWFCYTSGVPGAGGLFINGPIAPSS